MRFADDARDPGHPETAEEHASYAASRARALVQRAEPSEHLARVLDVVADAAALTGQHTAIARTVEQLTGLRLGEIQALAAVAEGAHHHRELARRTGQTDAAAAATVDGLVSRGSLARRHHPAETRPTAEPTLVTLTPRGEAVLRQSEAIQVRVLDAVVETLGEEEVDRVRAAGEALRRSLGAPLLADASRQVTSGGADGPWGIAAG